MKLYQNRNCQNMFIFKQGFSTSNTALCHFLVIYNNIYFIQNSDLDRRSQTGTYEFLLMGPLWAPRAAASPVWALPGHVPGHRLGEPAYHPGNFGSSIALHTPMYLFLANVSFSDIGFISTVIPKMLNNIGSGSRWISYGRCLTQLYFSLAIL